MSLPQALLQLTPQGWLITDLAQGRDALIEYVDPHTADTCNLILNQLKSWKATSWQLLITIPSTDILHAKIAYPQSGAQLTTAAWNYLLEEHLPWSAEEFYASWLDQKDSRWGFIIQQEQWKPLCDQLTTAGHQLPLLIPEMLLGYQQLRKQATNKGQQLFLLQQTTGVNLLKEEASKLTDWLWFSTLPEAEEYLTTLQPADGQPPLIITLLHSPIQASAQDELQLDLSYKTLKYTPEDEQSVARALLQKQLVPLISFEPPHLVQQQSQHKLLKEVQRLCLTVACLGWLIGAYFFYETYNISSAQNQTQSQLDRIYKELYPQSKQPASYAQIQNELRSLQGSRQLQQELDLPQPALKLLAAMLTLQEAKVRYRLNQIDITNGLLSVDLEVTKHEDLTKIISHWKSVGLEINTAPIDQSRQGIISTRLFAEFPDATTNKPTLTTSASTTP